MKTNIIINIGLSDTNGNPVELHHAIREIERAGITLLASGVVTGQWEGKPEQTLVLSGLAYPSPELTPRLYVASRALSQHCIAVWQDGAGELIGDNPNGWKFDPALFHFHSREARPVLSECQAMQAKHASESKARFAEFLRGTLIPDLRESGSDATADDFERCLFFMGE